MKEFLQLSPKAADRMRRLVRNIEKRRPFIDKFKSVINHDFAAIIEEDSNKCVCCGMIFKGKSIGPHYKNKKQCAEFKANLKRERTKPLRDATNAEMNQEERRDQIFEPAAQTNANYDVFEESEDNLSVDLQEVDDFFYSQ